MPAFTETHPSTTTCPPTPKPTPHPELHARASLDSLRHDSNDCAPTQPLLVTLRLAERPQAAGGYVRHRGQNSTNPPGCPATAAWVEILASRSAADHERDATEARRILGVACSPRTRACVNSSPRRRRPVSPPPSARKCTTATRKSLLRYAAYVPSSGPKPLECSAVRILPTKSRLEVLG